MERSVVIVGTGAVTPLGHSFSKVIEALDHADHAGPSAQTASSFRTVDGFDGAAYAPRRLVRKVDEFTLFALGAGKMALDDAGIDVTAQDAGRIGILVGNTLGGWRFTDRELRHLHNGGVKAISPFQATAWFPAAPQGQLSILFGIKGYSKTVDAGRASGLVSIGLAARAIASGKCDVMLAGGTEALGNPFTQMLLRAERDRSGKGPLSESGRYRPFDQRRDGCVAAEGASFLVLEEREHALKRGANILATVSGFALANTPIGDYERATQRTMQQALARGGVGEKEVDVLLPAATGTPEGDRQEAAAVAAVFGSATPRVSTPKAITGHLCGAAGALDVALAAYGLSAGRLFPSGDFEVADADSAVRPHTGNTVDLEHKTALVNGVGSGGVAASVLLSAA